MKFKFHLHTDEKKWNTILNENIDTLTRLNEEGVYFHDKKYNGIIRDQFFEARSKHILGDLKTYNPWLIRGDFEPVGSNIELELSATSSYSTKSQRQNTMLFIVLPLIVIVAALFKKAGDPDRFLVMTVCSLIPVVYHLIRRWFQFFALRHFIRNIEKSIEISIIPN